MKKIIFAVTLIFIFASSVFGANLADSINTAKDAEQLVIVSGTKGSNADFYFYEKNSDGEWEEIISCPAYIGKKGWGKTREGDLKTPCGVYHFTMAFGINDDPGCAIGYTKVDNSHYWDGDSNSKRYNQFVSTREYNDFNKKDSEHIIDYNLAYKYCLNISYNEEGTPKKGSAIFLHCYTKNKFTSGGVLIPEEKMIEVLKNVKSGCVVVMDEKKNIKKY